VKGKFILVAVAGLVTASIATAGTGLAAQAPAASPQQHVGAAAAVSGSWTVYHHDNAHTGYDSSQPAANGATAGWVSPTLDGSVYGEPLVYNGIVYVGTLNNTVYALNQGTGAVVWSKNVGAPQTSGWQCGNINPTGILGTGVIDVAHSRVYYVAFLTQFTSYYLYGFDLATGAIVQTTQILPNGFDWTIQQERGALALSSDGTHVYIPFGGRAGDCGPYHAWVEGVPTAGGLADEHFEGPSTGAGSWAAGGVVVDDSTGHVFFSTGNAIPCSGATLSDSVVETTTALAELSFFQPLDWQSNWCGPDSDLGSTSPVLISPSLMFMSGKYGQGFLLNPTALGGTGGQLFPAQSPYVGADVCFGKHSDATFGSFAYAAPRVYIECEGHGLVSLTVNAATPSFSLCDSSCSATGTWQAGGGATFGPPIIAGGVAWVADINGGGLYGFNATTGAEVYHSAGFGVTHFTTPSEAGGQIFVGSDTVVRSFNMTVGCASVGVSISPPSPSLAGTPVTVTGTAAGCINPNPSYEFWILYPGSGTWQLASAYSTTATYNWTTAGLPIGTYRFSVWVKDSSSTSSYDAFNPNTYYTLTSQPCTSVGVSAAPPPPDMVGTVVTVTGAAGGCPTPSYEFWILYPGSGTWQLARAYSTATSYSWATTGLPPGTYRFSVWARDATSAASYDAWNASQYFTLTSGCSSTGTSASPPGSSSAGTPVTVMGIASGCLNANPLYEFWILYPGSGTWQLAHAYSTSATYPWATSGLAPGTYRFSVWVKDSSSVASYDAWNAGLYYTITAVACSAVGVSSSPPGTATVGTMVTITGSATCPNANPLYEFWVLAPGAGAWQLAAPYSTSATLMWNTTGKAPGTYRFSIWVHDSSNSGVYSNSLGSYDAFNASLNYTLT
jgi:hypothetical protein